MFENINIKSFKEYVAEQELLKEADYNVYSDSGQIIHKGADGDKPGDPNIPSAENPEPKKDKKPNPQSEQQPEQQPTNSVRNDKNTMTVFENFSLKYPRPNMSNQDKLQWLKQIIAVLENTIINLKNGNYLEKEGFEGSKLSAEDVLKKRDLATSGICLNLTGGLSYKIIRDENEKDSEREAYKQSHEARELSDRMKKGDRSAYREAMQQGRNGEAVSDRIKQSVDAEKKRNLENKLLQLHKELEELKKKGISKEELDSITKEIAELEQAAGKNKTTSEKAEAPEGAKLFKEEILDEGRLRDLFKLPSELSAGVGNRYRASEILKRAGGRKGNKLYDRSASPSSGTTQKTYDSFVDNGRMLIQKNIKNAQTYIDQAKKLINDKEQKYKYVGNDETYLANITTALIRCMSVLKEIGDSLRTSMFNYKASLNRLSREFNYRTYKNQKEYNSFDAGTAVDRIERKLSKIQQRAERKENEQPEPQEETQGQRTRREIREKRAAGIKELTYDVISSNLKKIAEISKKDGKNGHCDLDSLRKFISNDIKKQYQKKKLENDFVLTADDTKRASALACHIIFTLLKNAPKTLKEITVDDSRLDDNNLFDNLYNEATHSASDKHAEEIHNDTLSQIQQLEDAIAEAEEEKNKKQNRQSFIHRKLNGIINRKAKSKPADDAEPAETTASASAKDFNGVRPQKPQAANIFDYAVEKAKQANEK